MTEFVMGRTAEREDIIDFINYVFSQAHHPHDFKKLSPKSYADNAIDMGAHYLAKKDGKIKAAVAARFIDVSYGGKLLKYSLIGNVAVHPYSRGEGYMKHLMQMSIADAREKGVDIIALGGRRQRYAYFGFEHVGANLQFTVNKENVRHCFADLDISDIAFLDFEEASDSQLKEALALYKTRPFHSIRPWEEYRNIMRSWGRTSRLIMRRGIMIGYSCGEEIVLTDESDLGAVLKALFTADGTTQMKLTATIWEPQRAAFLESICENSSIAQVEQIRVLNWEKVLQTLLSFKAEHVLLEDGLLEICIDGEGFEIHVEDNIPTVKTASVSENALHMSANTALLKLFGLNSLLLPDKKLKNWPPLPFFIDSPDTY